MKLSAIKNKYKNQWVLLECSKTTKDYQILEAEVLEHSKTKKRVEDAMDIYMSPNRLLALEYLGGPPKNIAYVL